MSKNSNMFQINKRDMLLLIMDYLREEGYDRSYISLEVESNVNLYNYDQQIELLRRLILDGEWEEVEKYFNGIKHLNNFPYNKLLFEIKKEKLIEEIELQQSQNEVEGLAQELKEIQNLGLDQEFNELITYLKVNNEEDNQKTNIISRRLNTFNIIRKSLLAYFPLAANENAIQTGKLRQLFSRLLEKISNNNNITIKCKSLSLDDIDNLLESNTVIDTEPNRNTVIQNVSLTNDNNATKKALDALDDLELNLQLQDNSNSNLGLSKTPDKNELSDLDQEEYYMKSCYDFYNYDITSLTLKKVIEDTHPIRCCCYSPKGDYFAIGTNSRSVKIFDLSYIINNFNKRTSSYRETKKIIMSTRETIGMIFEQKNHHYGSIFSIDWSSSGKLLATGSNDKTIKLMNIPELDNSELVKDHETLELQITGFNGTVRSLCFEPTNDLTLLSANTGEQNIKVWDTEKGTNISDLEGHCDDVTVVKWSNDSQLCCSAGLDKTIRFWDLREDKSTSIISALKYSDICDISVFTRQKANSSTVIAAGHSDGTITVWDYNRKCVVKELYEHSNEVRAVCFSPDGRYLISGAFDSKIKIFDVSKDYELMGELEHSDRVVSCKWHPEIPLLISTSADKTARVWIPQKF